MTVRQDEATVDNGTASTTFTIETKDAKSTIAGAVITAGSEPETLSVKAVNGEDTVTVTDEFEPLQMHLNIVVKNAGSKQITALGLVYKNDDVEISDNTDFILFSRAVVDPVYMRAGRTYVIHYTIYF